MISKPHATETMNYEFGNVTYTPPSTYYLRLSTTAITFDTGTGFTEPTGVGYSAVSITNDASNWEVNENGYITNKNTVEFPAFNATASGTNITHWFISKDSSGGTALYYDVLRDGSGDPVVFPVISGGKVVVPAGYIQLGRANEPYSG